jgi:hypothetical protein
MIPSFDDYAADLRAEGYEEVLASARGALR